MVTFYLTMVAIMAVWGLFDSLLFRPAWMTARTGTTLTPWTDLCYRIHEWGFAFITLWSIIFVVASYAFIILLILKACKVLPEIIVKYL